MISDKRTHKNNKAYILRWAKKIKAIEQLSGKCTKCGITNPIVMEFHHPNEDKEDTICDILHKPWNVMVKEIEKCILLCRRCHMIHHFSDSKSKRNRENKLVLLKYIGKNECEKCSWSGYNCALEFHHTYPNEKELKLSQINKNMHTLNDLEQNVIDEINKCQLLCSNCHKMEHSMELFELFKNEIYIKSRNLKSRKLLDYNLIKEMYKSGTPMTKLSKIFDTSVGAIHQAIHSKRN